MTAQISPEIKQRYNFNQRWMNPDTGRFITEDPIRDGLLWYSYCNANPMTFVDPTGLEDIYILDFIEPQNSSEGYWEKQLSDMYGRLKNRIEENYFDLEVNVNFNATLDDLEGALQDDDAEIVAILAHGSDLEPALLVEDTFFRVDDIDELDISDSFETLILLSCDQGSFRDDWRSSLPEGSRVVGWNSEVDTEELLYYAFSTASESVNSRSFSDEVTGVYGHSYQWKGEDENESE